MCQAKGQTARLISVVDHIGLTGCLTFYFRMVGEDGGKFTIKIYRGDNTLVRNVIVC